MLLRDLFAVAYLLVNVSCSSGSYWCSLNFSVLLLSITTSCLRKFRTYLLSVGWIDNIKDDIADLGLKSEQQRTQQEIEEGGDIK